jgi:hypothetical protein
MRAKIFLATALCAIPLGAFAQPPNTSAVREIARIDGEYSDLSVAKGMPAASVEYFAENGIAFAPTAVTGKNIGPAAPISRHTLMSPVFDSVPCRFALL